LNPDLERALEILGEWVLEHDAPSAARVNVKIAPENVAAAAKALVDVRWGYLTAITGLDTELESQQLEVLYHYCRGADILTLRALVPRDNGKLPSVCGAVPIATVYERELAEMFGVTVTDTPDPSRLFLPDDWPDGLYPLRKDADLASAAPDREEGSNER
jgi:Ni,Fe-hydrogenase III component G